MSNLDGAHFHVVGVAGVGMSAIAQLLVYSGFSVTGSDRYFDRNMDLDVLSKLKKNGVRLVAQDGSAITRNTTAIVVSTAIEDDNPDCVSAREHGVDILHRSEALSMLLQGKSCVAVTGTSGKSTVTGMTGWILDALGADPVVVNGAPVLNWKTDDNIGNVRFGSGIRVVEADESDKSLLNLQPDYAVITNVSKDHFSVEESSELFNKFASQAACGVIDMINNPEPIKNFSPEFINGGSRFFYKDIEFRVNVPGRHNAENTLCAVLMCELLGYPLPDISAAIASFIGIERRLEKIGEVNGIAVFDDYAHNPVKIKAAWQTLQEQSKRVIGIWRPHGYRPLRLLMSELNNMFMDVMRSCDKLYILPVYDAGGTTDRSINSDVLVEKLHENGVAVEFVSDWDKVIEVVVNDACQGDVILTVGARDPDIPVAARELIRLLRA